MKKPSSKPAQMPEKVKGNHEKLDISMLCLLANEATSESRKLIKKLGESDPNNHLDLEYSLAKLYKSQPDKLILEKHFADIHPHKDFILKYLGTPEPEVKDPETIKSEAQATLKYAAGPEQNEGFPANFHNMCCSGMSGYSNACGCGGHSNFGGNEPGSTAVAKDIMVVGLISVVAIFGMVIYGKR